MNATITRAQVRALLSGYRDAPTPAESTVDAWQAGLAGCSLPEVEAALLAVGPGGARTATPSQIVGVVEAARSRRQRSHDGEPPTSPSPRPAGDRAGRSAGFVGAGARGIRAVYAAMGWARNAEHDRARTVPCPFCKAGRGQTCGPLVRNRHGQREDRDPVTRMHPSRLAAANTTTTNDSALAEAR